MNQSLHAPAKYPPFEHREGWGSLNRVIQVQSECDLARRTHPSQNWGRMGRLASAPGPKRVSIHSNEAVDCLRSEMRGRWASEC